MAGDDNGTPRPTQEERRLRHDSISSYLRELSCQMKRAHYLIIR